MKRIPVGQVGEMTVSEKWEEGERRVVRRRGFRPMAKARHKPARQPRELLSEVCWCFCRPAFRSQARFEEACRRYNRSLESGFDWRPKDVVLPCPRVRVRPVFWDEFDPEEEGRFVAELTADGRSGFTAGELLFKAHNAFLKRWAEDAGDYVYFEGFRLVKAPSGDAPPLYDIDVGS